MDESTKSASVLSAEETTPPSERGKKINCTLIVSVGLLLAFALVYWFPRAHFAKQVVVLASAIGACAAGTYALTYWHKVRIQIGKSGRRFKSVRRAAAIAAMIGLSPLIVWVVALARHSAAPASSEEVGLSVRPAARRSLRLGSGKSVEILAVGPFLSTHGWSALMVKYRTQISIDDYKALRKEIDEIWESFVLEVERRGYQTAIISANDEEKGSIVSTNNSYDFVFEKRDRSWRTYESKDIKKLDASFVREFLDRLDWAFEHNNMNAALLYIANDWTITIIDATQGQSHSQVLDRVKFAAVTHATFAAGTNLRHNREILDITIGQDGTTARVESRETTEMTFRDRTIGQVERSTDDFAMKNGVMLWTKSVSTIESHSENHAAENRASSTQSYSIAASPSVVRCRAWRRRRRRSASGLLPGRI